MPSLIVIGGKGPSPDAYKDDDEMGSEEEKSSEPDLVGSEKKDALKSFCKALGVNPGKVDFAAAQSALDRYVDACHGGYEESDSEDKD